MIESKDIFSPEMGESETDAVVFIGNSCDFPNTLLRIVQAEFQGMSAFRINSFDSPKTYADNITPRLLIVDEKLTEQLAMQYAEVQKRFDEAKIVLAYRKVEHARGIFSMQQTQGKFSDMRFIPSNAPVMGWISMVRLLLDGGYMVPGDLLAPSSVDQSCIAPMPTAAPQPVPQPDQDKALTPRENEVLELVAHGHRNKNIANHLKVSEHTVKLHIHHIFAKIGVNNRTAATNWFLAQSQTRDIDSPRT
ncbi:LuxR C-terminal-related transcriptional regulator [Roseovarius sp. EL26]|uniref:helix-turn-helix domain-containing protein n=1 Tax=Roseovarius sp. EL26 TaxID=2126672 RepID=UPI0020B12C9C|nr:LuxR C-terminal-related transcriptional regulator [Roseovarius sp. EL26]